MLLSRSVWKGRQSSEEARRLALTSYHRTAYRTVCRMKVFIRPHRVSDNMQPAHRPTEAWRKSAAYQNPSKKRHDITEFRGPHLSGVQWQDLQRCAHNGRHGRTQAWRVLAVCTRGPRQIAFGFVLTDGKDEEALLV